MAAGGCGTLLLDLRKALDDVAQAALQVVALGRHGDGFRHRLGAADGGKTEIGSARVQRHDDS